MIDIAQHRTRTPTPEPDTHGPGSAHWCNGSRQQALSLAEPE
jgi:hypothetical protein